MFGLGHFHINLRKRAEAAPEMTPKHIPPLKILLLDRVALIVGMFAVLMNVLQLWKIWSEGSAQGMSLVSWTGFSLASFFWFYYALVHKERVLYLAFGITFAVQALIVLGILIYG
jgi:uncharacterized protein with PQ loop repeat